MKKSRPILSPTEQQVDGFYYLGEATTRKFLEALEKKMALGFLNLSSLSLEISRSSSDHEKNSSSSNGKASTVGNAWIDPAELSTYYVDTQSRNAAFSKRFNCMFELEVEYATV